MQKFAICLLLLFSSIYKSNAQTTDLSIVVEAQNLSGVSISQININEDFRYLVTIINSGDTVNGVTFTQTINSGVTILNTMSQNNSGGSSDAVVVSSISNVISGSIATMPSNSSVELVVIVRAPLNPGGIATNANVSPPDATTDTNDTNNQSIISIDVNDLPIDFSVVYNQITPSLGTSINAWDDIVTYQFTITNNSAVPFPLDGFRSNFALDTSINFGRPVLQLDSLNCLGSTNGVVCPDVSGATGGPSIFQSNVLSTFFIFLETVEFSIGGALTFEMQVKFLDPLCGLEQQPLQVSSNIELELNHTNISPNTSNTITTSLINADLCLQADLCIDTIQINPAPDQLVNWNEQVTFETIVCNMGPEEAPMRFFLQNLSVNIEWNIISITCDSTTGNITCNDFTLLGQDQFWESSVFNLPSNTTIQITTIVEFIDPETCQPIAGINSMAHVRSGVNLLDNQILDPNFVNNFDSDFVTLPPLPECQPEDIVDLSITKTQIAPVLPEGESQFNTTSWGEITYEIIATNPSTTDAVTAISDFMPDGENLLTSASLVSVNCVSTTGTASCFTVNTQNVGVVLDGIPQMGMLDVFWEILPSDNWVLPAQSSVTFHVVVDWLPECDIDGIKATNAVSITSVDDLADNNLNNNLDTVETYFAPCVDIVVQTYPEFTSVTVNQPFNWVIDITNSFTSSTAVNINFEDILSPEFTIVGTPTCTITSGTASCIPTFTTIGNTITGTIPSMEAASTIQITIPVTAPNFGGAFTNTAEAISFLNENQEVTPETNISISNIQVIAPEIVKSFTPDQIIVGQQSILEFTIINVAGSPSQTGIDFIDNLPAGITLAGPIYWVQDNGCTAIFSGHSGDIAVGVSNLVFPAGVSNCTFAVVVTSAIEGVYLNNNSNFTGQNNIDTSLASATLTVLPDTSNVDIEVLKTVTPTESAIGNTVTFTITATNVGTTTATNVVLFESLPIGYSYVSSATSLGVYTPSNSLWGIPVLNANQSETLTLSAQIISSNNLLNTASLDSISEIDRDPSNNDDAAEISVNNCLIIPKGVSPNDDGNNDVFTIPCIEDYSENNLKIFNRYGTLIFETNDYKNDWNGIPNQGLPKSSKLAPTGTYYYVLTINTIEKPFVGWLYLNY